MFDRADQMFVERTFFIAVLEDADHVLTIRFVRNIAREVWDHFVEERMVAGEAYITERRIR